MSDEHFDLPFESPNLPQLLTGDTRFRFRCYKGISCFNACCMRTDVTLAPYDILRLKRRFDLTSEEFLRQYTVPFRLDQDGVPGLRLRTDEEGTCRMLDKEEGCRVYGDRPTVCRYYPVALLNMRRQGSSQAEENFPDLRGPLQGPSRGPRAQH